MDSGPTESRTKRLTRINSIKDGLNNKQSTIQREEDPEVRTSSMNDMAQFDARAQAMKDSFKYKTVGLPKFTNTASTSDINELEQDVDAGFADYERKSEESFRNRQALLGRRIGDVHTPTQASPGAATSATPASSNPASLAGPLQPVHHSRTSQTSPRNSSQPLPSGVSRSIPTNTPQLSPRSRSSQAASSNLSQPVALSDIHQIPFHNPSQSTSHFRDPHAPDQNLSQLVSPSTTFYATQQNTTEPTLHSGAPYFPAPNPYKQASNSPGHYVQQAQLLSDSTKAPQGPTTATRLTQPASLPPPPRFKANRANAPQVSSSQSHLRQPITLPSQPAALPPPPRPKENRTETITLPVQNSASTSALTNLPSTSSASQNIQWKKGHVPRNTFGQTRDFLDSGLQSRESLDVDATVSEESESD